MSPRRGDRLDMRATIFVRKGKQENVGALYFFVWFDHDRGEIVSRGGRGPHLFLGLLGVDFFFSRSRDAQVDIKTQE